MGSENLTKEELDALLKKIEELKTELEAILKKSTFPGITVQLHNANFHTVVASEAVSTALTMLRGG